MSVGVAAQAQTRTGARPIKGERPLVAKTANAEESAGDLKWRVYTDVRSGCKVDVPQVSYAAIDVRIDASKEEQSSLLFSLKFKKFNLV